MTKQYTAGYRLSYAEWRNLCIKNPQDYGYTQEEANALKDGVADPVIKNIRLQKKIDKLKQQRDHYKKMYENYKLVISMAPHLESRYKRYEEMKAQHAEVVSLKKRCDEQAQLIELLNKGKS